MARDPGLEELVHSSLAGVPGLAGKAMFGGWGFLVHGKLLCGVRKDSLMLRVGPEKEAWALKIPGVSTVIMRGRLMRGYVRAAPDAYGSDTVREQLLEAALAFTRSLPQKGSPAPALAFRNDA